MSNPVFRAYFQALLITDVHARFHRMFGKGDYLIELSFSSTNYWGLSWCYNVLTLVGHKVYVSKPKHGKWGTTIVLSTYISKEHEDIVFEVYRENERAGIDGKLRGKKVPRWLYECKDTDIVYAFLAGLIDGDGTVNMIFSKKDVKVQFFIYTHDYKLAINIVDFLNKFNIRSTYYDSVKAVSIFCQKTIHKIIRDLAKSIRHPLKLLKIVKYVEYLESRSSYEEVKKTYKMLQAVSRRSSLEWYEKYVRRRCPATPT